MKSGPNDKTFSFLFFFIFLFCCTQQLKLNSETNYIGEFGSDIPIYISNFPSYSFDQKRIRDKLKDSLQNNGYFVVNNIENSKYYLVFKSDCFFKNKLNDNRRKKCELNFVLIKTTDRYNYFNSKNYIGTIIWRLIVKCSIDTLIKKEDELIDKVSSVFLKNA